MVKITLKKAYFGMHPNSGSCSQIVFVFLQNVHLITKYILPEKISLLTSLKAEIKGGGAFRLSPLILIINNMLPFPSRCR